MVAENIKKLRLRVETACKVAGRKADEVILVAVGKTFSSELMRQAVEAGVFNLAENYVQEFLSKKNELTDEQIRWHFIGHLQTNKVKYIVGSVWLIHSVDSIKLASEISRQALKLNTRQNILVEVNTASEASKFGVTPDDAIKLVKEIVRIPNLNFSGLMTVGRFLPDAEESRKDFRTLKEIKSELERNGMEVKHLSMGMSNNFEVAIEEGATIIRLGTLIFGSRKYNN